MVLAKGKQIEDLQERDDTEIVTTSMKRAFALTSLVYILYNYQKYMSSFNHNHHLQSFITLFIIMSITIFIFDRFTPTISHNLMYGIGWGVGAALLNKIISFK